MRKSLILLLIAAIAMPLGIDPSGIVMQTANAESSVASFQQGANGYTGTLDANISNQYIEWSDTGVTETTGVLRSYIKVDTSNLTHEKRALVKFTNLNLPAGAAVTGANLTLVVTDWESGYNNIPSTILRGYYMNTPWNINAQKLGWLYRDDPSVAWSAEGGKGTGDVIAGKSFTISGFNASGDQTKTVALDPAVVQNWINNPSSNHGFILINETGPGAGSPTIHSSESSSASKRPKLQITYTVDGTVIEDPTPAPNQAPVVTLTSPSASNSYTAPAEILLSANATDDGSISKVEFYQGNTKIGEDTNAPYQIMWSNVTAGTYAISAKATDNLGLSGNSLSVSVVVNPAQDPTPDPTPNPEPEPEPEPEPTPDPTPEPEPAPVNQPPVVSVTSPSNNAEFASPASVTITASASDPDGSIARVEFYRGTTKIGEDATAPYSYNWQNVGAGEYHISAVAVDNQGEMTGSEAVRIVVIANNLPPIVSITSPSNGATFTPRSNITITATASDPDGSIARVDFYRGTTKIGEDRTAPYSYNWRRVSAGEYHISAVAVDNQGEMTGSEAVHIIVGSVNRPPAVSITSPANDAEFTAPANISINAAASDPDGSVTRVEFYRGTTKIGEDATAPYSFNWNNVSSGEYHISAVATDNQGEMTGSAAVRLIVNEPVVNPPPTEPPAGEIVYGVNTAVCNSATVPANAIYVSTSGNDSTANGSASRPYRTVRAAVNAAVAGATIVVRGGTYVEPQEIRIRVQNVTIRSYPGEWAIIDRSSDTSNVGINMYVGSNGSSLQCIEVIGGFYAVSTETKWDWGDPNDRSGASNLLIENTKLHNSYRDVVKIKPGSDNITIRNNEIYNSNAGQMTGSCNAEGIDNVNGDKAHVAYNHIHHVCSNGVYLKGGAADGIIEYNLVENTGGAGILLGFDTSPEFFDLTVNPEYYENFRGIARYNLVRNTGWSGIGLYASKDAQVYNNTIINAAGTYHSPIYFGITFQDWDASAGRPANVNPIVRDNIVVQETVNRAAIVGIRYANELGGLSALTGNPNMSNNCYYQSGRAASFEDGRSSWSGGLSAWKTHINGDNGSIEANPGLDSNYAPTNSVCAGRGHLAGYQAPPSGNEPPPSGTEPPPSGTEPPSSGSGEVVPGELRVFIQPSEARSAGAKWRRAGTSAWRNSGESEINIPAGTHLIEFSNTTGWSSPANMEVTVGSGYIAPLTGYYVQNTGNVWHVDDDNKSGTYNGSAQYPDASIQYAVARASSGDTIKLAVGTYGPINTEGKALTFLGGFSGANSTAYASGQGGNFFTRSYNPSATTISGGANQNGVTFTRFSSNAYHGVLDNVRIANSSKGVVCDTVTSWPHPDNIIVSNSIIENNGASGVTTRGAGIIVCGGSSKIVNNIIRSNQGGRGPAIYGSASVGILVDNNKVQNNTSYDDHGGGVYLNGPITFSNNIVSGNRVSMSYGWGGGVLFHSQGTVARMSFNKIYDNYSPLYGAGVFIDEGATAYMDNDLVYRNSTGNGQGAGVAVDDGPSSSHVYITNSVIANNNPSGSSGNGGNGVYADNASTATISNSILWGNGDDFYVRSGSAINVSYSLSSETWSGTGNISSDPLFADSANNDYHLRSTAGRYNPQNGAWVIDTAHSPAIDAGNPSSPYALETAPNGGRINMGAYGNTAEASRGK